ncbi:MAG: SDR family NAD(P)-dependent oxidoreductase [Thermoanaerobaculia bacterium]
MSAARRRRGDDQQGRAVLVGATRGMGRALARCLAERGDRLFLLGRDVEEMARSAADLEARGAAGPVGHAALDLRHPDGFTPALDAAWQELGAVDLFVLTAADFDSQETLESHPDRLRRLLDTNLTGTLLLLEAARRRLLTASGGTLCAFSSVAGERGRKPVVLYGATKAALTRYLEGLDHRYRQQGLKVICVKPGFVKTSMTAGLDPPPFAGTPEQVARTVLRAIDRGRPVVYAPPPWRWVMLVVRHLPRFIMRRVGF